MGQNDNSCLTPARPKTRSWIWLVGFIVFCVSLLSVIARAHFIQTRPFAGRLDGQESESHILVTHLAFEQTSWKIHHFLSIFTLGAPYNKYIDQHPGAASADRFGNYYYTSFPPLTFVLPYIAVKSVGASPSMAGLRWYNIVLQILSAFALAGLVFLCTKKKGVEFELRLLASATTAVIYMTAPECLKSHSINLWAEQFYALLLIIQIICFLFYPSTLLLFVFAFIGCLADWTSYLANLGMAGIALFSFWKTRDARALRLTIAIILGCLLAGLCIIGWYATVIPVHDYFHNLIVRGSSREGSLSSRVTLIIRYSNSFGLFSIIGLVVFFLRPWSRVNKEVVTRSEVILPGKDPFLISFLIMVIALLENLLMGDHANLYSYDRLKGVQLLALFIVWGTTWSRGASTWIFGLSVMVGLFSICFFWRTYEMPQGWSYVAQSEQERIGEIIVKTASTNGPAFFNGDVRGAEVYYAQRNIFQLGTNVNSVAFVQEWCRQHHFTEGTLYEISGHYPFPEEKDLPRSLRVCRVYASGKVMDIGFFQIPEKPGDYHAPSYQGHPFRNWSRLKPGDILKILLWQ
ncbi:MAG: hypothetical protein ABSD57_01660 [Verrucomicrobiota bacterium]|jgi:hypothetical protein